MAIKERLFSLNACNIDLTKIKPLNLEGCFPGNANMFAIKGIVNIHSVLLSSFDSRFVTYRSTTATVIETSEGVFYMVPHNRAWSDVNEFLNGTIRSNGIIENLIIFKHSIKSLNAYLSLDYYDCLPLKE